MYNSHADREDSEFPENSLLFAKGEVLIETPRSDAYGNGDDNLLHMVERLRCTIQVVLWRDARAP